MVLRDDEDEVFVVQDEILTGRTASLGIQTTISSRRVFKQEMECAMVVYVAPLLLVTTQNIHMLYPPLELPTNVFTQTGTLLQSPH